MKKTTRNLLTILAAIALLIPGFAVHAVQPLNEGALTEKSLDNASWAEISAWLKSNKQVVELGAASVIIETNDTAGDTGFQIFLDGVGWRNVRVYDSNGSKILHAHSAGGVRNIGGGTELFMESSEPPYEDLDGMQALIDLLPEGEYYFLARYTDNSWATGTAEFTHTVPDGPEIVYPAPAENEDDCSTGVFVDSAYIEWEPVETDIWGSNDIEIVGYQVIVETDEEEFHYFTVTVPADVTMVAVPEEVLTEGTEFIFEVLAIESSGNQTITEGCFETAE